MFTIINRKISERYLAAMVMMATLILLSACASAPVSPESSMSDAREAITSAERAGARQYAGAELDEAQQKLVLAEEAISNEEMDKAKQLAQESFVVAELALARTESPKALKVNKEMRRSTDALIEEMQRAGE